MYTKTFSEVLLSRGALAGKQEAPGIVVYIACIYSVLNEYNGATIIVVALFLLSTI